MIQKAILRRTGLLLTPQAQSPQMQGCKAISFLVSGVGPPPWFQRMRLSLLISSGAELPPMAEWVGLLTNGPRKWGCHPIGSGKQSIKPKRIILWKQDLMEFAFLDIGLAWDLSSLSLFQFLPFGTIMSFLCLSYCFILEAHTFLGFAGS